MYYEQNFKFKLIAGTTRRNPESRKKLVMLSCWDYTVYIQQWRVASRWQYLWQQNLQSVNKSRDDKMHKSCDIGNTRTQSDATWILASNDNTCMPFSTYHPTFGKPHNWLRRLLRSGKYEKPSTNSSLLEFWEVGNMEEPLPPRRPLCQSLSCPCQCKTISDTCVLDRVLRSGKYGELSAAPLCHLLPPILSQLSDAQRLPRGGSGSNFGQKSPAPPF